MYLRSLAAALVAALPFAVIPAHAADIFRPYDSGAAESPYDDPRYADIYGDPPPYQPAPRYAGPPPVEPRYEDERYVGPSEAYPDRWSREERRRGEFLEPMPYPPSFEEQRRTAYAAPACVPRYEIRRELRRDGWSDFHDLETRDSFAFVTARRPNGELYRLKIDRCAGEIVRARPVGEGRDSYAWRRREPYPAY